MPRDWATVKNSQMMGAKRPNSLVILEFHRYETVLLLLLTLGLPIGHDTLTVGWLVILIIISQSIMSCRFESSWVELKPLCVYPSVNFV